MLWLARSILKDAEQTCQLANLKGMFNVQHSIFDGPKENATTIPHPMGISSAHGVSRAFFRPCRDLIRFWNCVHPASKRWAIHLLSLSGLQANWCGDPSTHRLNGGLLSCALTGSNWNEHGTLCNGVVQCLQKTVEQCRPFPCLDHDAK